MLNEEKPQENNLQNIKELGALELPRTDDRIYVLPIIGQVEGHG